jgi:hypothetical protein
VGGQPILRSMALLTAVGGIVLHAFTVLFKAEGGASLFLLGLFLWSCAPYAICIFLALRGTSFLSALGGAALALCADCYMFWSVFLHPKSSTAALGLLFMPLWNLVVFMPLGMLIGHGLSKLLLRGPNAP